MCYSGECPFEKWEGNCSIPGGRKPPGAYCMIEEDWNEDEQEEETEEV